MLSKKVQQRAKMRNNILSGVLCWDIHGAAGTSSVDPPMHRLPDFLSGVTAGPSSNKSPRLCGCGGILLALDSDLSAADTSLTHSRALATRATAEQQAPFLCKLTLYPLLHAAGFSPVCRMQLNSAVRTLQDRSTSLFQHFSRLWGLSPYPGVKHAGLTNRWAVWADFHNLPFCSKKNAKPIENDGGGEQSDTFGYAA
jgi:hypothetical protein